MADKASSGGKYGAVDARVAIDVLRREAAAVPAAPSPLMLRVDRGSNALQSWEFPGWGNKLHVVPDARELAAIRAHLSMDHPKLSEWLATAICGNDILSSCLYVSGIVASKAGKLAPVALALVAAVLYLYRFIYGEVVHAIPLNGGSYNVLLNTTTKRIASVAAALAILSYIATGVVSGTSACNYLASQLPALPIVPATVGLLFFFAVLSVVGITESAVVALVIFALHVATLAVLCVISAVFVVRNDFEILRNNLSTDFPDINMAGSIVSGNVVTAIFFGTSAAMLGISGFETSSQFVEEQAPGVFRKTLRNMWWGVAVFNPTLALLGLGVLPLEGPGGIIDKKDTVLAEMGRRAAGDWMGSVVAFDAFIVLSGAVLTAYVGVVGLMRRLASDRILPNFLLEVNAWRQTNHFIIIGFFLVSASLVVILDGDTETLSGVYTYAFLGLMSLFGIGCMLLKFKRENLPRTVIAPWWTCIVGVVLVMTAFLGNLLGDPTILTYFSLYFLAVLAVVTVMFERTFLLRMALYCMQRLCPSPGTGRYPSSPERPLMDSSDEEDDTIQKHTGSASGSSGSSSNGGNRGSVMSRTGARGGKTITRFIQEINEPAVFFFCKSPNLSIINKAILYVRTNEQTSKLFVVHCHEKDQPIPEGFMETVKLFDHIYLKIQMNFLAVEGSFGPALVEWISRTYKQPKNMMFIKQPSHDFAHTIATLGGVRVITG